MQNEIKYGHKDLMERLYLYNDIVKKISKLPSVINGEEEEFIRDIITNLGNRLKIDRVSYWEYDGKRDEYECILMYKYSDIAYAKGAIVTRWQYPTYFETLEKNSSICISRLSMDKDLQDFYQEYMHPLGIARLIAYVVYYKGKIKGFLGFSEKETKKYSITDELAFCGLISDQISIAYLNKERVEFNKKLVKNEKVLKKAQELGKMGHWYHEIDTNVFTFSDEACKIFNINDKNTLNEEEFVTLLYNGDFDRYKDTFRLLKGGTLYEREIYQKSNVNYKYIKEHIEALSEDNKTIGYLGILQDITCQVKNSKELDNYRQNLEDMVINRTAELEQARELAETANRAKSLFLSNMSHEIRTPMNAIFGYAQLIQNEPLSPIQQEQIKKLKDAADHLLNIINDILDISKIEAGKVTIEIHNFEPARIIDQVCKMLIDKITEKKLDLRIDLDNIPFVLVGDGHHLTQILLNILSNAVKFTQVGSVTIKARILEEKRKSVKIRFEVIDTGIGITKEQQERLFKDFEQADFSTTRLFGGTGLGLAISKKLANLMGGIIGVESEYGEGSTFFLELPFEKSLLLPKNMEDISAFIEKRALIIDDIQKDSEIVKSILNHLNIKSDSVSTGRAGINKIIENDKNNKPYSLVFLDYKMPEESGIDIVKELNSIGLERWPTIFLMSAYENALPHLDLNDLNIKKCLNKPLTPSIIVDALSEAANSNKIIDTQGEDVSYINNKNIKKRFVKGKKILLVEDNIINQEVIKQIISTLGMEVEVAENGKVAIDMVISNDYDLIFMDVQMPVMDGYDATLKIRQLELERYIPIVAMTANAFDEDKKKCITAGMDEHIPKPVEVESFIGIFNKYLPLAKDDAEFNKNLENENKALIINCKDDKIKQKMLNRMRNLKTLDVYFLVKTFEGNCESCFKLLNTFVTVHQSDTIIIRQLIIKDEIEEAKKKVHSLKGVSGIIGAKNLEIIASEFEDILKKYQFITSEHDLLFEKLDELSGELDNISKEIKPLVEEFNKLRSDEQIKKHTNYESVNDKVIILEKINEQVIEYDTKANRLMDEHKEELEEAFGEVILELKKAINEFDYEKSRDIISQIFEGLKTK